eukprot:1029856-Prorocentrum_minimum.AAC.5
MCVCSVADLIGREVRGEQLVDEAVPLRLVHVGASQAAVVAVGGGDEAAPAVAAEALRRGGGLRGGGGGEAEHVEALPGGRQRGVDFLQGGGHMDSKPEVTKKRRPFGDPQVTDPLVTPWGPPVKPW